MKRNSSARVISITQQSIRLNNIREYAILTKCGEQNALRIFFLLFIYKRSIINVLWVNIFCYGGSILERSIIPRVEIGTAEVYDGQFFLSLRVIGEYNPAVHSPKVNITFTMGNETRYLPIFVQSYYQNLDLETFTIVCEYRYNLEYLFSDVIKNEPVSLSVSLLYGNEHYENIPISNSGEFVNDDEFKVSLCSDSNEIVLKRTHAYVPEENPLVLRVIKTAISFVYGMLVRIVGLLFIPWLIIDSFMAYFELKSGYVSKLGRTFKRFMIDNLRVGYKAVTRMDIGRRDMKKNFALFMFNRFKNSPIVPNRITFLSNRRDDLTGNFENIYDVLRERSDLDIQFLLEPKPMHRMSTRSLYRFAKLYATSAVVIIDDFYELTTCVPKREEVKLVQVWHACGAFKTFGFSRLGKPGGPRQTNKNHRMYDRAIVSSNEIRRFYAEGFGIPLDNVVATGVPRTDMFFDEKIKLRKQTEFYDKYPQLKDKKIILFAPTFRGNGRLTGNYPMERLDLKKLYEETNGEYAILVKMHPFVSTPVNIPKGYEDFIIDFSQESELNDLLFVTDVLITDYSSVVFEASLLSIPMLFYAYDLSEYIATRDFYYEYEFFLPGKLTPTFATLVDAINDKDFEVEKIEAFKRKFFDDLDGKSSKRVADMILELLQ